MNYDIIIIPAAALIGFLAGRLTAPKPAKGKHSAEMASLLRHRNMLLEARESIGAEILRYRKNDWGGTGKLQESLAITQKDLDGVKAQIEVLEAEEASKNGLAATEKFLREVEKK